MKIGGKPLVSKNYVYVTLIKGDIKNGGETYRLKVCSIPAGWSYRLQDTGLMDFPKVPVKLVQTESGKVARKSETGRAEYKEDPNDPKYRKTLAETIRRLTALRIREVLSEDASVEWGVEEPAEGASREEWRDYADELADEVEAALTSDEIDKIIEKSDEASCSYEVENAIESF